MPAADLTITPPFTPIEIDGIEQTLIPLSLIDFGNKKKAYKVALTTLRTTQIDEKFGVFVDARDLLEVLTNARFVKIEFGHGPGNTPFFSFTPVVETIVGGTTVHTLVRSKGKQTNKRAAAAPLTPISSNRPPA